MVLRVSRQAGQATAPAFFHLQRRALVAHDEELIHIKERDPVVEVSVLLQAVGVHSQLRLCDAVDSV